MNFITNLFSSVYRKTNYDSIFVVMNRYFKFARYIVAKKNWNAKNLTKVMIEQIFPIFEMFTNIIFDRNSSFIFNYWSAFCYYLQIWLKDFITFYSQIDKQTKKQNQISKQYFGNYVNYQQNNWIYGLLLTEYAYNNSVHSVIEKYSTKIIYDNYESLSR